MTLIEQRHPKLGELMRLWRAHCRGEALPSACALASDDRTGLAASTVLLGWEANATDRLTITVSGKDVDALYGEALAGAPAARLAPTRGDADQEARSAITTARPVVIEDELRVGDQRRRIARLYLPLASNGGSADGALCGVFVVA